MINFIDKFERVRHEVNIITERIERERERERGREMIGTTIIRETNNAK